MTDAAEVFGMARGYAPSAHKVIAIDFDGTIYPWRPVMDQPDPLPGAVDAIRRLKKAGWRIVIFTSRLSPTWLADSGYLETNMRAHLERLLTRDGIPYDDITAEKVPAQVYVDDRAVRFAGEWAPVADWIIFSQDEPS